MKLRKILLTLSILSSIFLWSPHGVSTGLSNEIQLEHWPVNGEVILSFGENNFQSPKIHHGIDISAEPGTTVISPVRGKVFFTGFTPAGGGTISILTPSGYRVTLLQLEKIFVKKEMFIEPGAKIGTVAFFGDRSSSEPHIHLGLIDPQGNYIDPLPFLPTFTIITPTEKRDLAAYEQVVLNNTPEIAYRENSIFDLPASLPDSQPKISVIKEHASKLEIDVRKQIDTSRETKKSSKALDSGILVTSVDESRTGVNFHCQFKEDSPRPAEEKTLANYQKPEKAESIQITNLKEKISKIKYEPESAGSKKERKASRLFSKNKNFSSESLNKERPFLLSKKSNINNFINGVIILLLSCIMPALFRMLSKRKAGIKALKYCFSH